MKKRAISLLRYTPVICAIASMAVAIYLTVMHYEEVPPACAIGQVFDCARIATSSYSVIPHTTIPISFLGIGWHIVALGLFVSCLKNTTKLWLLGQFLWSITGVITIIGLIYIEIVLLHAVCMWCTVLHILIIVIFIMTLWQLMSYREMTL